MRTTCCPCGCGHEHDNQGISRRSFIQGVGGATVFGAALTGLTWSAVAAAEAEGPAGPIRKPLVVKPILTYDTPQPRSQTSWRSWGGIHTQEAAEKELALIKMELAGIKNEADFPVEFLPATGVRNSSELAKVADLDQADTYIVYAAGGGMDMFDKLSQRGKDIILFCRHKSGPVYLWYEIISPRYLRQHTDSLKVKGMDEGDVVVDSSSEILWRLRALCGLKNTLGTRIIAVGGPGRLGPAA